MKKIFVLLTLLTAVSTFGQNFDDKWFKVIQYENEGKIKSAHSEVERIYKKAVAKKDEVQIIKCFFYNSKYLQTLEENAQTKILANLKTEINQVSIPSKSILNLVYAKCLNKYHKRNSNKLYTRTQTDTLSENFFLWTNKDFENKIEIIYAKTLENDTALKQTSLLKYEAIFDFQTLEKFRTQTLYDYILKENIDYYISKINRWDINAEDFKDYKKSLSGNSKDFIAINFDFVKNKNLKELLKLYQKREITDPSAENQLERISFISNISNGILKSDEDFLTTLNLLQKRTTDKIVLKKIQLEKAILYSKLASKEIHPNYNTIAVAVLDSLLVTNDHSNSYKLAELKKNEITSKILIVQLQKYLYNKENNRAFISYQNVDSLTISFYKIDQKKLKSFENSNFNKDSLLQKTRLKAPLLKTISHQLINKKDYFNYTTEVLLPQLETGSYLVYFETNGIDSAEKAYDYETITVTNFTVLSDSETNTQKYQIVDRKTGAPIENVILRSDCFELKTDKNGLALYEIEAKTNYQNLDIEITKANDTLQLKNNFINHYNSYQGYDAADEFKARVQFYLDRAIYRPVQTVYYKGIAIQKKNNVSSVVPNLFLTITVEDSDYNEIKLIEVTTNEFGSFSGEFTIPKNGLTGEFSITADEPDELEKDPLYDKKNEEHPFWDNIDNFENSHISFKVEEYKRPKFEVVFDTNKETFLIDQNITMKGNAKAFSGSNISDSKVKYTVTRSSNQNYEEPEIIATGETKTDDSGKFTIEFIAKPALNTKKEDWPIFTYKVVADITDINGETRSGETRVKVGYQSLEIRATLPPIIETKNKNNIILSSTNLNGEFIPITGELKFYFVSENLNKFKPRMWEIPEIETIPDEEFNTLFPYEINKKSGADKPTEVLIHTLKIDTQKEKNIPLDFLSKSKSGYYKVVFSATDKFNNPIESNTNFELKQSADKYDISKIFTINQVNSDPKKDGYITVELNSVLPDLYLNMKGNYRYKTFIEQGITIKNHQAIIKIPIKKEYTNSIKIGFQGVFENYNFENQIEVFIKTEAPILQFEVESFRDKIQPGSIENWSFKIKNDNAFTQSEVLASMYDSSLDQFTIKNWEDLGFNEYYGNYLKFKSYLGFAKTYSQIANLNPVYKPIQLTNENTNLMWFGFDFNNNDSSLLKKEYQQQLTRKSKKPSNATMISGIISEGNLPLPGANILIRGTTRGVQTDFDGYYEIEVAPGEELVISFVGMKEINSIVGNSKTMDFSMEDDSSKLEEVVIGALGIKRSEKAVGYASQSLKKSTLDSETETNIANALSGRIAGVQITNSSGAVGSSTRIVLRGNSSITGNNQALFVIDGVPFDPSLSGKSDVASIDPDDILSMTVLKGAQATALYGIRAANGVVIITTKKGLQELTQVKGRTNLSETAFFLPNLTTDKKGAVSFNFTAPEALTSWKLRLLAHQKNTTSGYLQKNVITQKELMVLPNFPRFFREKDSITITSKVSNITKEPKTGIAVLQLFDAATMQAIDSISLNIKNVRSFTIPPFGNTTVSWKIYIPEGLQGIQYKVLAKSGDFSDGEESILPVLTNTILVTESIPVWVKANTTKTYTLDNLKNNSSTTLRNHQLTLEYTSNPAWMAIQSLPYLMEYEHECSEQTFARFYANALATEIINSNPKIAEVFETWRKNGKLNSKLEQNEELKSIILAETPWFKDAESEEEKKNKLALLFDLEKMKNSQEVIFEKLKQKQRPSGGFVWFDGTIENEYITSHILTGLGHLKKLSIKAVSNEKITEIAKTGIPYLDNIFLKNYHQNLKNSKNNKQFIPVFRPSELHYLYTRSFYLEEYPLSDTLKKASNLYVKNIKENWLDYPLYQKGLAALVLNRFDEKDVAKKVIENLKETASNNEDWGMYWIENKAGWYWYQAPIETQSLLIEAFAEVNNDNKSVDEMKVWLLKNKQTKNWPTTKATTDAVYALLMQGSDWLNIKDNTIIKIGDEKIATKKLSENEKEAETGYIKLNWKKEEIKTEMASITIDNKSKVSGYGGIYWQYFENLDKIKTNSGSVLLVSKELYLKNSSVNGELLNKISSKNILKLGDLVTVRLIITTTENVEFIHLKDMRASCFEPINVLSEYKYKDGLGFYMSTKDAATHFFFDNINKGTYVLEYDIRVNNIGEFSNGITTIESMYAPEFSSHTKGIRVKTVE